MVPGSNLLNRALRLVGSKTVAYSSFAGRELNDVGIYVPLFSNVVEVIGSVQAVPRSVYQSIGLDWQKNYVMFYTTKIVIDVERSKAGDRFVHDGKTWQVLSQTDWSPIDGWTGALAVQIHE